MKFIQLYNLLFEENIIVSNEDIKKDLQYLHTFKSHEQLIVYTVDGHRYEYSGNKDGVSAPERINDNLISLHNHIIESGFSYDDIFVLLNTKTLIHIAIICKSGIIYHLKTREKSQSSSINLDNIRKEWQLVIDENFDEFYTKLVNKELTEEQIEKQLSEIIHLYFAKKYNLLYLKENN